MRDRDAVDVLAAFKGERGRLVTALERALDGGGERMDGAEPT